MLLRRVEGRAEACAGVIVMDMLGLLYVLCIVYRISRALCGVDVQWVDLGY